MPYVRRRELLVFACASVPFGLAGCQERGFAMSAFSAAYKRTDHSTAYVDGVGSELASWLSDEGFVVGAKPDVDISWSSTYESQSDAWYASDAEDVRVMARRPTSGPEGLDVYVWLRVDGSAEVSEQAQAGADARMRALIGWWTSYRKAHPAPAG